MVSDTKCKSCDGGGSVFMCNGCQGYGPRHGTIRHREGCTPHLYGVAQCPCWCQTKAATAPPAAAPITSHVGSKYLRTIYPADGVGEPIKVDIYAVIVAFMVTCPGRQHGRDVTAAATVQWWINKRIETGKNAWGDGQIVEALDYVDVLIDQSKDPFMARLLWNKQFQKRPAGLPEPNASSLRSELPPPADGWKQSYGVRVGRDEADCVDLVFTRVATQEFQLYANEAAHLRDLLVAADIPGHPADERYEAVCASLGFHPETELGDVIEAIQSVRSEARNYPALQLVIESLRHKLAEPVVEAGAGTEKIRDLQIALAKINDIRNSIIGFQTVNWSEHVYPLVAALESAGFNGVPYSEAKDNAGTLLDKVAGLTAQVQQLEGWKGDQVQALIKMSIACLNAGFKGDSVVEGVKWMEAKMQSLREALAEAKAWLMPDPFGPFGNRSTPHDRGGKKEYLSEVHGMIDAAIAESATPPGAAS